MVDHWSQQSTYARGVKAVAPSVCVTACVPKAIRLQCRFSSISLPTRTLSLNMPALAPDKGHVFLVSIVNNESSNVYAKIFSDIHFRAKNLEC